MKLYILQCISPGCGLMETQEAEDTKDLPYRCRKCGGPISRTAEPPKPLPQEGVSTYN
jgi:hypothetical protein